MRFDDQKIKEILIRESYVTEEDIKSAETYAADRHGSIIDYLLLNQLITKDLLGQAIAEDYGVLYTNLHAKPLTQAQVTLIPEYLARKLRVVLAKQEDETFILATDNPKQADLLPELQKLFPQAKSMVVTYSLSEDIDAALEYYNEALSTRFIKILQSDALIAPEIIDAIFLDAILHRISDIHFEPQAKDVLVRFRLDGILHEVGRIPKEHYENVLNRIKVLAQLRIDEHHAAQDGAIRYVKGDQAVDLRVSIVPTLEGEKVVMRLLSQYVRSLNLSDLGFSAHDQAHFEKSSRKPFGMILITGPTGSGKTTTLYALLKLLQHSEINVTTIEDPVEYRMEGLNQIQVNPQTNLTFAKGLRSIARQDPDIILVGEIRDQETAEIAVNAALTGHLLLSTFHANDAATAIPRFLDMGIEPFLLASTLELVVAQRLVRKLCTACRYSVQVLRADIELLVPQSKHYFSHEEETFYRGKGCHVCNGTGYKGRIALFELITISPDMQDLILHHPSSKAIWEIARAQGSHTLFEDGVEKVKNGITTLEEVLRVASPLIYDVKDR
ncbi:MAG: type II/IV secretion system protein [Candidatus Abawacabacteria bacterium]|nr:type II/IV secretion system protein [Candidatus Abawacabacteria bacterium]